MRKVVVKVLRAIALLAGLALLLTWLARAVLPPTSSRSVTYSELATAIEKDQVEAVEIHEDRILARLRVQPGERAQTIVAERIPAVEDPALLEAMRAHHVEVAGKIEKSTTWSIFLWLVLPILALPILLLVSRGMDTRGRPMSFGRSKAKLYDTSSEQRATFADVAGVDESRAELEEVVRFLKEPERYRAVGARVPKGVLLVGPPGTGKTLLARAVAGESGVPFFSLSGSEFVEMFVGVGASRVRDLFEQAKARAPCIVFIDELDAVGKTRAGPSGFAANEEREQTLNQLLVEMDGFDPGSGLVIMAATNRPEILDRALLRAGRFDRQVLVDRPDVRGREAILRVHAKKVKLAPDVDLGVVAHRTPGMVGADLANVVNEAALASVRRNADVVAGKDFEEAIDRIQLGLRKEGRVMSEHEKRRVSFHEAGHALAALTVEHADPVHRVTIIPRSIGALGATLQLPTDDRYLVTREELRDQLCVLLAGRAAEEVACTDVSTGAQNDLERATETARQMVCRFGMSEKLGPLTYGRSSAARFLAPAVDFGDERNFSESTAELIDAEVRALVDAEHDRARRILAERNVALQAIANELLTKETLERADLDAILARVSSKVRGAAAQ